MNPEQVKSLVRQVMLFAAGIIAGTTFVSKFFTVDQVTAILTSDTVIGLLTSVVTGGFASAWALISRTNKNIVGAAAALPEVKAVITEKSIEGTAIANQSAANVVPAGSPQAASQAS